MLHSGKSVSDDIFQARPSDAVLAQAIQYHKDFVTARDLITSIHERNSTKIQRSLSKLTDDPRFEEEDLGAVVDQVLGSAAHLEDSIAVLRNELSYHVRLNTRTSSSQPQISQGLTGGNLQEMVRQLESGKNWHSSLGSIYSSLYTTSVFLLRDFTLDVADGKTPSVEKKAAVISANRILQHIASMHGISKAQSTDLYCLTAISKWARDISEIYSRIAQTVSPLEQETERLKGIEQKVSSRHFGFDIKKDGNDLLDYVRRFNAFPYDGEIGSFPVLELQGFHSKPSELTEVYNLLRTFVNRHRGSFDSFSNVARAYKSQKERTKAAIATKVQYFFDEVQNRAFGRAAYENVFTPWYEKLEYVTSEKFTDLAATVGVTVPRSLTMATKKLRSFMWGLTEKKAASTQKHTEVPLPPTLSLSNSLPQLPTYIILQSYSPYHRHGKA